MIDPETRLDIDVPFDALLLYELLQIREVCGTLIKHKRAVTSGMKTTCDLIDHARTSRLGKFGPCTSRGCPRGHNEEWWRNFVFTIRYNLWLALAWRRMDRNAELDGGKIPLVNATLFLVWRQAGAQDETEQMSPKEKRRVYREKRRELARRASDLAEWLKEHQPRTSSVLILKES